MKVFWSRRLAALAAVVFVFAAWRRPAPMSWCRSTNPRSACDLLLLRLRDPRHEQHLAARRPGLAWLLRLHPSNAATLFALVQRNGAHNTTIHISNYQVVALRF